MMTFLEYLRLTLEVDLSPPTTWGDDRTPADEPIFTDTLIPYTIMLNQDIFSKIMSSLLNGAFSTYPLDYNEVITSFWMNLVEAAMSCEEIADCIADDEEVLVALLSQLTANGYAPNPDSAESAIPVQLTSERTGENLLDGITDCSDPAISMAIARAIVRELDETVQDVFQNLELATNASEASAITLGAVPVASAGAKVLEFVDWIQDTVVETYLAAYNQSAEDTIACAIFCHLESECEISLDSLLEIYEELGSITVPSIDTFDDLVEFIVTTTMSVDVTGVAIFHYFLLHALKFGGAVFELAGFNDLVWVIKNASFFKDYSYQACDDCPPSETPTTYWKMVFDFGVSPFKWVTTYGGCRYEDDGWLSVSFGSHSTAATGYPDFGAAFVVNAVAQVSQVRDPDSGGSNDSWGMNGYGSANFAGGIIASYGNGTGYVASSNADYHGNISSGATTAIRSLNVTRQASGVPVYPTRFTKIYKIAVWGKPNAGNVKPVGSVWAGNSLPATLPELFD